MWLKNYNVMGATYFYAENIIIILLWLPVEGALVVSAEHPAFSGMVTLPEYKI